MAYSFISNSGWTEMGDDLTRYLAIAGNPAFNATEVNSETPIRDAGVFSNLFVSVDYNDISANSTVITLRKSQANTSVTVSYGADQSGIKEDTSNTATFAATDEVCFKIVTPAEAGSNYFDLASTAIQFAPSTSANCISFLVAQGAINFSTASTTAFFPPAGRAVGTVAEASIEYRIRDSFTSSDFYVNVTANARTTNTIYGTRVNSGAGNQAVTYSSTQTGVKEDTSNTDALSAGDDYNYYITTSTGVGTITEHLCSTSIINISNTFNLLAASTVPSTLNASENKYAVVAGNPSDSSSESFVQVRPRFTFTAKELGVYVTENNAVADPFIVTLRDNGADGNLTVSYSAGQTGLKNDSANTDIITSGTDEINHEVSNTDAGGSIKYSWIGVLGHTPFSVDEADTITITEGSTVTVNAPVTPTINVNDSITITEDSTVTVNAPVTPEINVLDAITVNGPLLVDSYSEANQNSFQGLGNPYIEVGQSFTGNGGVLNSVKFYLQKGAGAPVGPVTAKVYGHSGTFGTSSVPDGGSALATSDSFEAGDLPVSYELVTFTFSGEDKITLEDGTHYCVSVCYVVDAGNVYVGRDSSSPTHSGNYYHKTGVYSADNGYDTCFYVYPFSGPEVTVNAPVTPEPSVLDSITITDASTVTVSGPKPSVSDTLTITESSIVLIPIMYVDVSDSITITESSETRIQVEIDESDSITITESSTAAVSGPKINVSDTITITDSSIVYIPTLYVEESEVITITESSTLLIPTLYIDESDSIAITEDSTVSPSSPEVSASDSITISEYISIYGAGTTELNVVVQAGIQDKEGPKII